MGSMDRSVKVGMPKPQVGRRAPAQTGSANKRMIKGGGKDRQLPVLKDSPDIRDRYYDAPLIQLRTTMHPPKDLKILDQGTEGACTGFGLAAVINLLLARAGKPTWRVSQRMLYEMARFHDEWPGEDYEGSSLRGAIRGWHNMGVCLEKTWPYKPGTPFSFPSIEQAKEARNITLGAYFRLRPELSDYHAALCQAEVLYVSANVHAGWSKPDPKTGVIPYSGKEKTDGGHAFAIVGYDERGFWIQNSWNTSWGKQGLGLWTYEDWLDNVVDAWAVRLAVPAPQVFGRQARSAAALAAERQEFTLFAPKRAEIAGHFAHVDNGKFAERGEYWSSIEDVAQTAKMIAAGKYYDHLLVYVHGGLNTPAAAANRIKAFKEPFKRNGVYPYSIMYDTGLVKEIIDLMTRGEEAAKARVGWVEEYWNKAIEDLVRKPGTAIWEEMKRDARIAFEKEGDGAAALKVFATALAETKKKIHLVGHSTGAIVIGHLLDALDRETEGKAEISTCSLLAPACTTRFFEDHYVNRLGKGKPGRVALPRMRVYNLTDQAEQDDNVGLVYRNSLLYLVSRAFERNDKGEAILGMEQYASGLPANPALEFIYAGRSDRSQSTSHGGFDNDPATMNDVLAFILGRSLNKNDKPFTKDELDY